MIYCGSSDQAQQLFSNPFPKDKLDKQVNRVKLITKTTITMENKVDSEWMNSRDLKYKIKIVTYSGIWCDFIFAFSSMLNICTWSKVVPGSWASKRRNHSLAQVLKCFKSFKKKLHTYSPLSTTLNEIKRKGRGGSSVTHLKINQGF